MHNMSTKRKATSCPCTCATGFTRYCRLGHPHNSIRVHDGMLSHLLYKHICTYIHIHVHMYMYIHVRTCTCNWQSCRHRDAVAHPSTHKAKLPQGHVHVTVPRNSVTIASAGTVHKLGQQVDGPLPRCHTNLYPHTYSVHL